MKKSNFLALILGIIGGVFFALGMCMTLIPEWAMGTQGIFVGIIGAVILLATILVWRKMEGKKATMPSGKTIAAIIVGVLGALLLGVGMCLVMIANHMIVGIVVGVIGILVLLVEIPLTKGLH